MRFFALSMLMLCPWVSAQDEKEKDEPKVKEEVQVIHRLDNMVGIAITPSEGTTGSKDLQYRPVLRPGELLETVPGLIVTQHSGDGKANQYFLRGFNLDHGTDFGVSVDHVQVNMPTHGHGQGYADINFLIPELIEYVAFQKGPYHAENGDFGSAGSTQIEYVKSLDKKLVSLSGGQYNFQRFLFGGSTDFKQGNLLAAAEVIGYDGPWVQETIKKWNGVLKFSQGNADRGFDFSLMHYTNRWASSDQLPQRVIDSGEVDVYGQIDPDLGGETDRFSLSSSWHATHTNHRTQGYAFLVNYRLDLTSNFTYFLDNPETGDEFIQKDKRWVGGFGLSQKRFHDFGSRTLESTIGFQFRADSIDNGLYGSQDGSQQSIKREDEVIQSNAGVYADAEIEWDHGLRTGFGLRADHYYADVDDHLGLNSGSENDSILSPKFNVSWMMNPNVEWYLAYGHGFHSNDARGTTIRVDPVSQEMANPVPALVKAKGLDLGVRLVNAGKFQSSVALYRLDLDSELVFVGDGGGTEASRPSRRKGVEMLNHFRPTNHLSFDLDLTFNEGEFNDNDPAGKFIPGAVGQTVVGGIQLLNLKGFSGAVRVRHFGDIHLTEDGSQMGKDATNTNLLGSYQFSQGLEVSLEILNVFDRRDPDVQYFYASRLPGEPEEGVEDLHFHPIEKRNVRASLRWNF